MNLDNRIKHRGIFPAFMLVVVITALGFVPVARAVDPAEMLSDPSLEAQARDISRDLRCLVCQNQSIDDSNAPLARDLRRIVRQRLLAGDDERKIKTFLVDRYGQYVLMRPPFNATTWLLWLTAPLVLAIGTTAIFLGWRSRRQRLPPPPLTTEEQKHLAELGAGGGPS